MTQTAFYNDHAHDITTIDTGFMRPRLAASHLLLAQRHAAFIDVGTTWSVPRLLQVLQEKQIAPEQVDYVIVTHVHLDHAGGAGALMQQLPNARCVVHPRGARHLIDPTQLINAAIAVYGEEAIRKNYGDIIPIPSERILMAEDNFTLDFRQRTLRFLDTAGHARHHFCIFDEMSQSFFTGDTFGISYREFDTPRGAFIFATTTPTQFDPKALHESIDRLLSYQPQKIYLTHYGEVQNIAALAENLHASIDTLISLTEIAVTKTTNPTEQLQILTHLILEHFHFQLQQQCCHVEKSYADDLLTMDAELNAQGLLYWQSRR
ncbi:MBL fold metallo-hydrolase [Thioflexithrix psekupsensis]|uniref:MBL fold metallo-hydrolase n=1 Tax=Thioflexithrix psekupsensis TaxID=1570016 RepID=A0A251X9C6_9GAMM|nr:MBL fold metallo-hydrolase [Thioflexithrix psekupsensis]OUD14606.1 MBL fold metallo-hydrolase [Thioflexithrix psekupsensis]